MNLIDKHIINRSALAIKCLSLNSNFYDEVQVKGLSANHVYQMRNKYFSNIFFKSKGSQKIEDIFLWLIKIGVLRREVDGQGLTSKVRLTPLGRKILETNPDLPNQKPSFIELIKNWAFRKSLIT